MTSKIPKLVGERAKKGSFTEIGEISGLLSEGYLQNHIIQDVPIDQKGIKQSVSIVSDSESNRHARILAWIERDAHPAIPPGRRTLFEIKARDGRSLVALEER